MVVQSLEELPRALQSYVRESLPGIHIAISIEPRLFVERMAVLAEAANKFSVERHYTVFGEDGFEIVNLRWLGASAHNDAGAQLIVNPKGRNRVLVEMRASFWNPDPPTRATYCEFAREIVTPLVRSYNKAHGARYCLYIQRPGRPYRLPPQSNELFQRFAVLANIGALHPLDWKRFYEFVLHSRAEAPAGELRTLLLEHGFPKAKADELSQLYRHLWTFKRLR